MNLVTFCEEVVRFCMSAIPCASEEPSYLITGLRYPPFDIFATSEVSSADSAFFLKVANRFENFFEDLVW